MNRNLAILFSSVGAVVALASAQGPRMGGFGDLRPPTDNERGLRHLTPEEIPPNLNYCAMDPLCRNDVTQHTMGHTNRLSSLTSYYHGTR